jgi:hypothetical protein
MYVKAKILSSNIKRLLLLGYLLIKIFDKTRKKVSPFLFFDKVGLILAQNERLWHALHMRVEREEVFRLREWRTGA